MSPVSICHSLLCCRPARVCSRVSKDYITQRSSLLCLASVCSRVSTDRISLRHALQHCHLVAVCQLRRLDRSCFLMTISVMLQSSLHLLSSLSTASSPVSRPSSSQPFNRHTHTLRKFSRYPECWYFYTSCLLLLSVSEARWALSPSPKSLFSCCRSIMALSERSKCHIFVVHNT